MPKTTTDELRAAAERTRDWYERQAKIGLLAQNGRDALMLADAYLASHPPDSDDSLAATVEWVDAEMPMLIDDNPSSRRRHYRIVNGVYLNSPSTPDGWGPCELWTGFGSTFHRRPVTRRDVRQLVALLKPR